MRIIADHIRAATFIITDGVVPSNKERGYVLRKLIRRAIRFGHILGVSQTFMGDLALKVIDNYKSYYPELDKNSEKVKKEVGSEEARFRNTLHRGLKELGKHEHLSGKIAFNLYQSFGFPWEMIAEIAKERGQTINKKQFEEEFKKHQELSRTASKGMFAGGLADKSDQVVKLHTATHLLQQALRQVLGNHVRQKGSHITAERLRFDFSHSKKLTEEEIKKVGALVNKKIKENLPVTFKIIDFHKAIEEGALTVPEAKYPEKVKVYFIDSFSKEICGGPHADFTGSLGLFKIVKEEALGTGIRRIYAILQNNVASYEISSKKRT